MKLARVAFQRLLTFYWTFGLGFTVGGIYVALLMTFPKLIVAAVP